MSVEAAFVSTGSMPRGELVSSLVAEAHERFRTNDKGALSDVYPALERVSRELFGICVAGTDGHVFEFGDADVEFTIMSVAKPFVCQHLGADDARRTLGVNATGLPFNSVAAVEQSADGRTNPMVNAGAIAAASVAPGTTADVKWRFVHEGLCRFAGRELSLNAEVYESASATNHRNREIAAVLERSGAIFDDPADAVDVYTRQSSLDVTTRDLAVMGATLADGGVNPVTGTRVVDASVCRYTLAVMTTAGLYETSGDWLCDVGLPGKSGIGGGIVTVSPGKGGLGTFAPRLDDAGNSVNGQLVGRFLSRRLGFDLFVSQPRVER
jgi:glutaminase